MSENTPTDHTLPEENPSRKRGGRPRKEASEKQAYVIKLSTNERLYKKLQSLALQRDQSLAELVRDLCQEKQVKVLSKEQESLLSKLGEMATHLNQLSMLAYQQGFEEASDELFHIKNKLQIILKQW